jgi:hypothetical protein
VLEPKPDSQREEVAIDFLHDGLPLCLPRSAWIPTGILNQWGPEESRGRSRQESDQREEEDHCQKVTRYDEPLMR